MRVLQKVLGIDYHETSKDGAILLSRFIV